MKYTINVNQKAIADAGFFEKRKTDLIDWAILGYIAHWMLNPKATKDGEGRVWINYKHLWSEMPALNISSKPTISRRLKKLEKLKLLDNHQNNFDKRLFSKVTGVYFQATEFTSDFCRVTETEHPVTEMKYPVTETEHTTSTSFNTVSKHTTTNNQPSKIHSSSILSTVIVGKGLDINVIELFSDCSLDIKIIQDIVDQSLYQKKNGGFTSNITAFIKMLTGKVLKGTFNNYGAKIIQSERKHMKAIKEAEKMRYLKRKQKEKEAKERENQKPATAVEIKENKEMVEYWETEVAKYPNNNNAIKALAHSKRSLIKLQTKGTNKKLLEKLNGYKKDLASVGGNEVKKMALNNSIKSIQKQMGVNMTY